LRKDFIVEPYQVSTRVRSAPTASADCRRRAVATPCASSSSLRTPSGWQVLVEVPRRGELAAALSLSTPLIGINNRSLRTFATNLQTTLDLLPSAFPRASRSSPRVES
jgi:indole-3-glycerol phosphate synthase